MRKLRHRDIKLPVQGHKVRARIWTQNVWLQRLCSEPRGYIAKQLDTEKNQPRLPRVDKPALFIIHISEFRGHAHFTISMSIFLSFIFPYFFFFLIITIVLKL